MSLSINKEFQSENLDSALRIKLMERLEYEKKAAAFYEAILNHFGDKKEARQLKQFYQEELQHIFILEEAVNEPHAHSLNKANIPQTYLAALEALLELELVDNVGWEVLIELAEQDHDSEKAIRFQQCLNQESKHQEQIKQWVMELTLNDQVDSENHFMMKGNPEIIH